MWGKRSRRRSRPERADARPEDEWGPCEYLDDRARPPSEEDDAEAARNWRAARHGRPEDWPSRPAPPA